ncbi:hypothetical protein P691DRAFT_811749 [Macrolepiota fuliginosa MF-IS2]|uniref:Uncharacterized protein n=1 Tax=Macrolepiota fuliginosa MF-IS2 TaxID=1400762 RepID=A0A9P5XQJ5_9AGAR|nr:hypothetical protein P691DRAFT_811749 [Macrolepiota fuliginosa MF-IS2]
MRLKSSLLYERYASSAAPGMLFLKVVPDCFHGRNKIARFFSLVGYGTTHWSCSGPLSHVPVVISTERPARQPLIPSASTSNHPTPLVQGNNATTSSETLATIASIQMRTKAKSKPKKPPRVSSTPVTESDKLMSANTYIGPVKKKGRPKGPSGGEAKVKTEEPAPGLSQNPTATPTPMASICIGTSTTTTTIQSIANPNSTPAQKSDSGTSSSGGLDLATLAALFSVTQNEATQNGFLLNALNLIDSPASQNGSQTPINPVLVEALRQLLNNYSRTQPQATPTPTAPLPISQLPSEQTPILPSNDEEIILLDKENVNPAAFRRRAEQAKLANNLVRPSNSTSGLTTTQPARGLGARSIENSPPKTQSIASVHSASTSSLLRKRTLDDCMEERDHKRNKNNRGKGKEKERSDKKESQRFLNQQQTYGNGFRHYPRVLASTFPRSDPGTNSYYRTPVDPWTSPPRPPRQENITPQPQMSDPLGGTSNQPIEIPDSPQAPRVSASSPIKPTNENKKSYIVPEWARTSTATQPRLSEEARRAADAAAEKKKEERRANRRKTNAAAQERSRQRGRMANSENNAPSSEPAQPSESHELMRPPPQPIMPKSDLPPIIASSDTELVIFPPCDHRTRSPSPTPRPQLPPPVTPKRPSRVASSTPGTAEYNGDSLFTPLSIARRSTGKGSPLHSPGMFGSPLARKRYRIFSPTSYRGSSKKLGSESPTTTIKVNESSEDTREPRSPTRNGLDESLDDPPPSSLPIASSDVETDEPLAHDFSSVSNGAEDFYEDEEDLPPRKQHWVGLPPSSPPPPMSPCLMPVDDDADIHGDEIDDNELPVASETDEPEDEPHKNATLKAAESNRIPSPASDDLKILLPENPSANTNSDQGTADDLAFLEQFTTIGSVDEMSDYEGHLTGDLGTDGGDLGSLFPGDLGNMDLHGFLETLRPMIHHASLPDAADQEPTFDLSSLDGFKDVDLPPQPIDHAKLAADLQAILSGCVV